MCLCKNLSISSTLFIFLLYLFIFVFLGPYLQHMEVPGLGVKSVLQLPDYATATATWDLRYICHLHHSSQQCWILKPLSKARDRTRILMDPSQIHFCCSTMGTPPITVLPMVTIYTTLVNYHGGTLMLVMCVVLSHVWVCAVKK